MPVLIAVVDNLCALPQITDQDTVGLVQQDAPTIDRVDHPEVRKKCRVLTQSGLENELDRKVRISVQASRIIDVEAIQDAIGKLVIAWPVAWILKPLSAHAHDHAVTSPRLPTAENVKVVQVGGLIFKQERSVAMASGESAGHQHQCAHSGPHTLVHASLQ